MSAAVIQPVEIPADLAQWRPGCDMSRIVNTRCDDAATHALITHGGCRVRLTCDSCYQKFLSLFEQWFAAIPAARFAVCAECRAPLHAPWDAFHLEPI